MPTILTEVFCDTPQSLQEKAVSCHSTLIRLSLFPSKFISRLTIRHYIASILKVSLNNPLKKLSDGIQDEYIK